MVPHKTTLATAAVATTLLLVGSMVAPVGGTLATQGDDYPEDCDEAPIVDNTGITTGVIDSPADADAVKFKVPKKGDYVTVSLRVPNAESKLEIDHNTGQSFSIQNGSDGLYGSSVTSASYHDVTHPSDFVANASWEVWAEETGDPMVVCLVFSEKQPENADVPYEYAVSLQVDSPDTVTIAEKITRLEQMLDQKNETISQLQNTTTTTA